MYSPKLFRSRFQFPQAVILFSLQCRYVLEQILSGESTETVVEQIHEYLTAMSADVRSGKIKLDDFIIFKVSNLSHDAPPGIQTTFQRLGKNPEDYPDAKSQPHVQVALKMKAKGSSARAGDVIPYVFCLGDSGESAKSAQADRAHHPDEVRKAGNNLKIG